jgi:hypothetical protein
MISESLRFVVPLLNPKFYRKDKILMVDQALLGLDSFEACFGM